MQSRKDCCDGTHGNDHVNPDIRHVVVAMPAVDTLFDLAELFKLFADSTRIRIMSALAQRELCVCEISEVLSMGQSAVSHQLRLLRQSKLVRVRREGKSSVYALDDDHVHSIIRLGLEHLEEGKSR